MPFDYVTWSIWLVGFVILVVWIYVPVKEIRKLLADRKKQPE